MTQEDEYITKDSGNREKYDSGAVRDTQTGKGRYDLLSPLALRRIAKVYERGAVKYGDRNYEKGMPVSRFLQSAIRHTFQYIEGYRDEDHLAQASWNLMSAMHIEEMVNRGLLSEKYNDAVSYIKPQQSKKLKIALDIDGVIVSIIPSAIKWGIKNKGKKFTKEDVKNWDSITTILGLNHDETFTMYNALWEDSEYRSHIEVLEPEVSAIVDQIKKYADVTIVSAATGGQAGFKVEMMRALALNQPIMFVPFGKSVKQDLDFDVFIDDRLELIELAMAAGKIGILYDQPWNRTLNSMKPFPIRIQSLWEAVEIIANIKL